MLNRLHLLLLLLSLAGLSLSARPPQDEITFFAQIEHDNRPLYAGDSCVVSIVLYSPAPFRDVRCTSASLKVRGGHARLLPQGQRTQQRVVKDNRFYMAMVWQQWVVGSEDVGKLQFSPLQFEGEFSKVEMPDDPFDRFFYGPQETGRVKRKCKMNAYTLPVLEKPKRSTREILQSGGQVA